MNPRVISFIILSLALLLIMIYNIEMKKKFINILFLILSIIFLVLIILVDNNFVYDFLKCIITYIWYPTYLLFVLTVIVSIIVFIYTLIKKESYTFIKVINYILFVICFICYNIFQTLEIDTSLYSELYQNNSLLLMRIVNITMIIWLIINISLKNMKKNSRKKVKGKNK